MYACAIGGHAIGGSKIYTFNLKLTKEIFIIHHFLLKVYLRFYGLFIKLFKINLRVNVEFFSKFAKIFLILKWLSFRHFIQLTFELTRRIDTIFNIADFKNIFHLF